MGLQDLSVMDHRNSKPRLDTTKPTVLLQPYHLRAINLRRDRPLLPTPIPRYTRYTRPYDALPHPEKLRDSHRGSFEEFLVVSAMEYAWTPSSPTGTEHNLYCSSIEYRMATEQEVCPRPTNDDDHRVLCRHPARVLLDHDWSRGSHFVHDRVRDRGCSADYSRYN